MPNYLNPPIGPTDPDDLSAAAFAYLMAAINGYKPNDNNVGTHLIMALANMVATAMDVGSNVPKSIFRFFGESVVGIQPIDATFASTSTTWVMQDDAGYRIPAGTNCGFQVSGDTIINFITVEDVTVPPGETSTPAGGVVVQAVDAGVASNGLGPGGFVNLDALAYVASVSAVSTTTGGGDAETDDLYLDRLVAEFQLFTPTPILGSDFAVMARNVAGVFRATGVDNCDPGWGPPENVVLSAAATTGGNLHGGVTYQFALVAVTAGGESNEPVLFTYTPPSGTNTNEITATWDPPEADADLDVITGYHLFHDTPANPGVLLRAGSPTLFSSPAVISSVTAGTVPLPEVNGTSKLDVERCVGVAVAGQDGMVLSDAIKALVRIYLESLREMNFKCYVFDAVYTTVDVTFSFTSFPTADKATVKAAAESAVNAYLQPYTFGVDPGDETRLSWTNSNVVRYWEIVTLLNNVPGLEFVEALTLNGGTVDLALPGIVSLPLPGAITGTPL